jgi:2-keto-4-pentenoate hydratase
LQLREGRVALSQDQVQAAADALYAAERSRSPIQPLTETYPDMQAPDAYAVQLAFIDRMVKNGAKVLGWKVGLTSVAMQQMLGVDQPDFGHLLDTMFLPEGSATDLGQLIQPRVEPEIAFSLKASLRGPGITAQDVITATEYVIPALEVIDSRVRDWKIKLADTIADNASCGRYVFGSTRVPPGEFDLGLVGMNFYVDGALASTATGAAVLGNPATAVAWLCNTLAQFGHSIEAGQVVMPGSLVGAIDAKPGTTFRADFDRIGSVSLGIA